MNDEKNFKERIEEVLSNHSEGLSIAEISRILGANRHTITKYIHELLGAGIVNQRDLGTVKLHYLAKDFPPSEAKSLSSEQRRKSHD